MLPERPEKDALLNYENDLEKAERAIAVLLQIIPALVMEAARDLHNDWVERREPGISEKVLGERLAQMVRDTLGIS